MIPRFTKDSTKPFSSHTEPSPRAINEPGLDRAEICGGPLPTDVWIKILNKLDLADLLSPLARSCKLFFAIAERRLAISRGRVRSLTIQSKFNIPAEVGNLRYVNGLLFGTPTEASCIDIWNVVEGRRSLSFNLPQEFAGCMPDDVIVGNNAEHVAIVFEKKVALFELLRQEGELQLLQLFDFDTDDDTRLNDEVHDSDVDALFSVRFSVSSRELFITELTCDADGDRTVRVSIYKHEIPRRRDTPSLNPVIGRDELQSTVLFADYDTRTRSLCGVQINTSPFQILIPPHRICDGGSVLGIGEDGELELRISIGGFYQFQVLGYSPNGEYMLETREVTVDFRTSVTVLLLRTNDMTQSSRTEFTMSGDVLFVQFSSDSATVVLLSGWPHGTGLESITVAGWVSLRTSDGSVLSNVNVSQAGDLEYPVRLRSSCRISEDGMTLYGWGEGIGWLAIDVLTGKRLWHAHDNVVSASFHPGDNHSVERAVELVAGRGFVGISRSGSEDDIVHTYFSEQGDADSL